MSFRITQTAGRNILVSEVVKTPGKQENPPVPIPESERSPQALPNKDVIIYDTLQNRWKIVKEHDLLPRRP
jgi:hypothetical protein